MALNDIKQALVDVVTTHGLGGLLGSNPVRFYPAQAPLGVSLPFATYQRIFGERVHAAGGTGGVAPQSDFDIRITDDDVLTVEAVRLQFLDALDHYLGTNKGVQIDKSLVTNDGIDDYNEEAQLHSTVMTFRLGWVV